VSLKLAWSELGLVRRLRLSRFFVEAEPVSKFRVQALQILGFLGRGEEARRLVTSILFWKVILACYDRMRDVLFQCFERSHALLCESFFNLFAYYVQVERGDHSLLDSASIFGHEVVGSLWCEVWRRELDVAFLL
jgi:hypothetical protein